MPSSKPFARHRIFCFFGIISPVLAFALIMLAISQAPWFSWTRNALSDLGVSGMNAYLFNSSLILSAVLYFIFILGGLKPFFWSQMIGRIGVLLLLLMAVFMLLIGVFPEPTPYHLHAVVSIGFFATLVLSLLILATALLQIQSKRKLGAFTLALAIVALLPWLVPNPWGGLAIPELIAALAGAIWSATMSIKLLTRENLSKSP